jgi:hypothetical protein
MAIQNVVDVESEHRAELRGVDQAVLPDSREMTILIRRDGDWVEAKRCRRQSIVEGIAEVRRKNDGLGWFLFTKGACCPGIPFPIAGHPWYMGNTTAESEH